MNTLYSRLSVPQLIEEVQQMNIGENEERQRLFAFFSANVMHLMPRINVNTHQTHFKEVCLHQHLSWKDQFDPSLHHRMKIKGWDADVVDKLRSSPGIICTYHTGSYRLINRLLAEENVSFSLVVNTEVFNEEATAFKTAFTRFNPSSSHNFDLIDAQQPTALLKMMRAYKSGRNLLLYVDGNTGAGTTTNNNVTVNFMNGHLSVRKGVAVLASALKCPIYSVACIRNAVDEVDFHWYHSICQPRGVERESFIQNTMQAVYDNLASALKEHPFQWECWLYLQQQLVLPKTKVPPARVSLKELTDARYWVPFKLEGRFFALNMASYSSFEITSKTYKVMRNGSG